MLSRFICVVAHISNSFFALSNNIPLCWFTFPRGQMMLSIFSSPHWPFTYLLWINVYSDPLCIFNVGLFVFLLLSCKDSWFITYISPLSNTWFANIFSYSVSCLFTFLMMSLEQKRFKFWWIPIYFFFTLVACPFGIIFQKPLPTPRSW